MRGYLWSLALAAVALIAGPATAQTANPVETFTVEPGGTYTVDDNDKLLLPVPLKYRDTEGVGVAIASSGADGTWSFSYYPAGRSSTFYVRGHAALRLNGMENGLYVYGSPTKTVIETVTVEVPAPGGPTAPAHKLINGVAMSNSLNGYVEDRVRFVSPYIFNAGVKSIRFPIKLSAFMPDGVNIPDVPTINGYPTKTWGPLMDDMRVCIENGVVPIVDLHNYMALNDPRIAVFWKAFDAKAKATLGVEMAGKIVYELQNETNQGRWDKDAAGVVFQPAEAAKVLINGLRDSGVTNQLILGYGGWNAVGLFPKAFAEIEAVGGLWAIDPLRKTWLSVHYYPTTSGNDQPKDASHAKPEITGGAVTSAFATAGDLAKAKGYQIIVTEIGMGGGARGWLANGSGKPDFNGKAWHQQYSDIIYSYAGTYLGSIAWGGGSAFGITYPFKWEYDKDAWANTQGTDFYAAEKRRMAQ